MSTLEKKIKKFRKQELKILLESNSLSCTGNKSELLQRAMLLLYCPKKYQNIAQEIDELYKMTFIPLKTRRPGTLQQLRPYLMFNEVKEIVRSQNLTVENGQLIVEFVLPLSMIRKIHQGVQENGHLLYEVQLKFVETLGINEWEYLYINVEVNDIPLDVVHPSPHIIYITSYCLLEKGSVNKVILSSPRPNTTMGFDFDISLVKRIQPADFLRKNPVKIKNNISTLVSNSIKGNVHRTYDLILLCPKTKEPMRLPCRGDNCEHLEVFDLITFLDDMQYYLKWKCPICAKIISYDMLYLDNVLKVYLNSGMYHLKFYSKRKETDFTSDLDQDVVYETEVVNIKD